MTKPQYRTPDYRAARKQLGALVRAGQAECKQPVCVMDDRWIEPGTPWDVAHDDAGYRILGAAHARCNRHEGGKKRHRKFSTGNLAPERWIL